MNWLVKKYLRRFDRELNLIKFRPVDCQKKELERIIRSNHMVISSRNYPVVMDQKTHRIHPAIPLSTYEDYQPWIEKCMQTDASLETEYFARSAGTTSTLRKYIPTTESFVKRNHLRASWYILHTLFRHRPNISIFNRRNLLVGGSIYQHSHRYIVGDVSGIMLYRIPWFFRPYCVPDINTAVLSDWTAKITQTAMMAADMQNISMVVGNPSWVLAVIRKILQYNYVDEASPLWPGLEAVVHGGVSFLPYKGQFDELFSHSLPLYLETYNASEGFFAFQDDLSDSGLLLMTANGVYYEFISYEQYKKGNREPLSLAEVAQDVPYVLIITTECGLLRYVLGDLVVFDCVHPPRCRVVGRLTDFINAFGEDLLVNHAEEAITRAAATFEAPVYQYTVAPSYLTVSDRGFHEWYIEFEKEPADLEQFEEYLDDLLIQYNTNYAQKREGNVAMSKLRVRLVPKGGFERYLKKHFKLHGQAKIPRLRNDREIVEEMGKIVNKAYGTVERT